MPSQPEILIRPCWLDQTAMAWLLPFVVAGLRTSRWAAPATKQLAA
ncbi:hypothetical protein [Nocardia australiensis]|nr:hypothetical protein [Nocardia australiensis]